MPEAALGAIEAAAESLRSTLTLAQALALAGRQVDMTGLEREVALLCAAAAALPPERRGPARRALIGLRLAVEGLLATLPAPENESGRASPPGPSRRHPC
ncbi:hypothetical protein BKE38_17615 [Pseudoroseomonas deserti]|uniref:Uncharacterized protein n=1 Tax=Teichococcus deserti TaxID=1817963 RepID=A0A1V2GZU1_9PROT|nr:hypothetical protein [Pseudoroseomonas deserti]ONG50634.1 hypothetical protein BKE38_17615 [Pseudoroseomonas deserti]